MATRRVKKYFEGRGMKRLLKKVLKSDSGSTAIEYGLIAAFIAVVIAGVLPLLGAQLAATFSSVVAILAN